MKNQPFIILTTLFEQEENGEWVAICKELGTSTFGDTFEEVKDEISELIVIHLNTLEEVGERENFFKENNIKVFTDKPPENIELKTSVKSNTYLHSHIQQIQYA